MRSPKQFLVGSILAILLIAAFSMSALAASPPKITNCFKASPRPKTVTLTCGDGNTVLKGLTWSRYGGASAKAKGTFVINLCEPNCAAGKAASFPVTVTASSPRNCKGGLRVYNKLSLQFPGRTPKSPGGLSRWTLGCPTSA
jgi:hypothetical protein